MKTKTRKIGKTGPQHGTEKRSSRARAGALRGPGKGSFDPDPPDGEAKEPPVPSGKDERDWAHPEMFRRADYFIDLLFEDYKHFEALHAAGLAWGVINRQIQGRPGFAERYEKAREGLGFVRDMKIIDELQDQGVNGYMKPVYYKGRIVNHKHVYSDRALTKLSRAISPELYSSSYHQHHSKPFHFELIHEPPSAKDASDSSS